MVEVAIICLYFGFKVLAIGMASAFSRTVGEVVASVFLLTEGFAPICTFMALPFICGSLPSERPNSPLKLGLIFLVAILGTATALWILIPKDFELYRLDEKEFVGSAVSYFIAAFSWAAAVRGYLSRKSS